MIKLTHEQKKAMLQLGKTDSTFEAIPSPVLDELLQLRLIYWRSKDNFYFTDEGEKVYKALVHEE